MYLFVTILKFRFLSKFKLLKNFLEVVVVVEVVLIAPHHHSFVNLCVFFLFSGSLIPTNCVQPLTNVLSQDSARTYTEKHEQALDAAVNGLKYVSQSTKSLPDVTIAKSVTSLPSIASPPSNASSTRIDKSAVTVQPTTTCDTELPPAEDPQNHQEPVLSMPIFDFL